MRYMMFIEHTQDYGNVKVPASLYEAKGQFIEDATKSGQFIQGAGLQPTSAGNRVTLKNGKITITDGPFTESKERAPIAVGRNGGPCDERDMYSSSGHVRILASV